MKLKKSNKKKKYNVKLSRWMKSIDKEYIKLHEKYK